jgi:hypothetical protein
MGARGVIVTGSVWNVNADGNWSDAGNWSGSVPNAAGASAKFGSIIGAPRTVTVDVPITVGKIEFENATNAYTLAGTNAVTLNDAAGAAINVTSGSHAISAPVSLLNNTTITVTQAADTLTMSGQTAATGVTITKAGAGALVVKNVRSDGLAVNGGLVRVIAGGTANDAGGTSVVKSLSIATGAQVDLTNNSLVIDYAGPVGTLVSDTMTNIVSGKLTSSAADANKKLGYGDNAVLGKTTFAGQTVDADSLLVKFTFGGDTNLDGQVDITDLGNLATNWQTAAPWTGGDFDYSGFVDISDLGILATNWQSGVGSPLGPGFDEALASVGLGGVSVPEPSMVGLLALSLAAGVSSRRRIRR